MNDEPIFQAGGFHVESSYDDTWCVYDEWMHRAFLYFATQEEAVGAATRLAVAAATSPADIEAEYQRLIVLARQSLESAGVPAA